MMLARAAEYLFWAGRYLERAEQTARLLDITYHRLLEAPPSERDPAWAEALELVGLDAQFAASGRPHEGREVTSFLVGDHLTSGSIVAAVEQVRDNARGVREHLSIELWEAVNSFCLELRTRDVAAELEAHPHAFFGFIRRQCQGIVGVANATWIRDDGWRFFTLGLMLERASLMSRLLWIRHPRHQPGANHEWYATLRIGSALQAHRRQYRGAFEPATVVELLLLSPELPRSVLFCLRQATTITGRLDPASQGRSSRLLGRLLARVEYADLGAIVAGGVTDELAAIEVEILRACDAVAGEYFGGRHDLDLHQLQLAPIGPEPSGAG
jgi:uncharacterized alpha-E superfamily protein